MEEREVSPNSRRPTFAMLGAVCGALGAVIRKLKVGLLFLAMASGENIVIPPMVGIPSQPVCAVSVAA